MAEERPPPLGPRPTVHPGERQEDTSCTARWPDLAMLTGQLAAASLVGYRRDVALYLRFCADPAMALQATSLALQEQTPENLR